MNDELNVELSILTLLLLNYQSPISMTAIEQRVSKTDKKCTETNTFVAGYFSEVVVYHTDY